jgi:hypothetical protein
MVYQRSPYGKEAKLPTTKALCPLPHTLRPSPYTLRTTPLPYDRRAKTNFLRPTPYARHTTYILHSTHSVQGHQPLCHAPCTQRPSLILKVQCHTHELTYLLYHTPHIVYFKFNFGHV